MLKRPLLTTALLASLSLLSSCMNPSKTVSRASTPYVATDFGALPDGKTLNTKPLQSLIDTIASHGGGTLIIPAGNFLTGPLFFKQGVNLHLDKNAVLLASTTQADYPQINTRFEGVERPFTSAFLNFDHMTDLVISGEGTINGQGDVWLQRSPRRGGFGGARGGAFTRPATRPTTRPAGTRPAGTRPGFGYTGRPRLLCISNSSHVLVTGVHLLKQPLWCLHILYSEDVLIDNISIDAVVRTPSSDGIDVDSSKNVTITRTTIACNDDNISIKAGKDDDGRRVNRPSENVTISDCTFGVGAGIAMGSEITGGIKHILIKDCTFNNTDSAARVKSQPSRGGYVEDITFQNITLNNVRNPVEFLLAWRLVGPQLPPADPLSDVHDIHIINMHGTARTGGTIAGFPTQPLHDVTFTHCNITINSPLRIINAKNINTDGLTLTIPNGPAIIQDQPLPPNTSPY